MIERLVQERKWGLVAWFNDSSVGSQWYLNVIGPQSIRGGATITRMFNDSCARSNLKIIKCNWSTITRPPVLYTVHKHIFMFIYLDTYRQINIMSWFICQYIPCEYLQKCSSLRPPWNQKVQSQSQLCAWTEQGNHRDSCPREREYHTSCPAVLQLETNKHNYNKIETI